MQRIALMDTSSFAELNAGLAGPPALAARRLLLPPTQRAVERARARVAAGAHARHQHARLRGGPGHGARLRAPRLAPASACWVRSLLRPRGMREREQGCRVMLITSQGRQCRGRAETESALHQDAYAMRSTLPWCMCWCRMVSGNGAFSIERFATIYPCL